MDERADQNVPAGPEASAPVPAEESVQASEPAQAAEPVQALQPAYAPQVEVAPPRRAWRRSKGMRWGCIAASLVVVAAAFFTIGWFASDAGDHERGRMMGDNGRMMDQRGWRQQQDGDQQYGYMQQQGPGRQWRQQQDQSQGQGQDQTVPTAPSQTLPTTPSQTVPATPSQPSTQSSTGYLGVEIVTVTPALQSQYKLSRSSGVLVAALDTSGPAAAAGIKEGDIITTVDGTAVTDRQQVADIVQSKTAGQTVSVVVDRNGQTVTVQVTLGSRSAITGGIEG